MSEKKLIRIGHEVHVIPSGDVVMHDESCDVTCACIPAVEAVKRDDGSYGWLYIHHAFDGRTASREVPPARRMHLLEGGRAVKKLLAIPGFAALVITASVLGLACLVVYLVNGW